MRAYGTDKVETLRNGAAVIDTFHHKGWIGRRVAGTRQLEHPGSAIDWDGELWEVITVERTSHGVRYVLERWKSSHVVRSADRYDAPSEQRRQREREDLTRRERNRKMTIAASLLLGHLPAEAQQQMHLEYGMPPAAPTIISSIPTFIIGGFSLIFFMAAAFGAHVGVPRWLLLIGVYLLVESLVRVGYAVSAGAPAGSLAGSLVWSIWTAIRDRGVEKRDSIPVIRLDPGKEVEQFDRYHVRLPLLALLPAAEQKRLQKRYGFDWASWDRKTAAVLMALVGTALLLQGPVIVSDQVSGGKLLAFFINIYFFVEQIIRLVRVSSGEPAGSALSFLVKPLTRGV